ncbi:MAG: hypothetical protein J7M26_10330, partial [Armatimonadetes bacterium]|nr:hypothetical protein [Armatimonadota bacterium]
RWAWRPYGPPAPIASPRGGKGKRSAVRFAAEQSATSAQENRDACKTIRHGAWRHVGRGNPYRRRDDPLSEQCGA